MNFPAYVLLDLVTLFDASRHGYSNSFTMIGINRHKKKKMYITQTIITCQVESTFDTLTKSTI